MKTIKPISTAVNITRLSIEMLRKNKNVGVISIAAFF